VGKRKKITEWHNIGRKISARGRVEKSFPVMDRIRKCAVPKLYRRGAGEEISWAEKGKDYGRWESQESSIRVQNGIKGWATSCTGGKTSDRKRGWKRNWLLWGNWISPQGREGQYGVQQSLFCSGGTPENGNLQERVLRSAQNGKSQGNLGTLRLMGSL